MVRKIAKPAVRKQGAATRARRVLLMVATRKGAWMYHGDTTRRTWRAERPHFLGHIVNHLVLDPRDGETLLAAAKTGHLGPTVFRSTDFGRSWKEAARPPRFRESSGRREGAHGRSHLLAHPGARQRAWRLVRRNLAAGPVPLRRRRRDLGAVFHRSTTIRSSANGWAASRTARPTDRSCTRSSSTRATRPHLYFAMSGGGVHESVDGGRNWTPLLQGLDVVEGFDPRQPQLSTTRIASVSVRATRTACTNRITAASTGSTGRRRPGCASARACRNASAISAFRWWSTHAMTDTAWVFPMDGTAVWPRTSPDGKPAVYVTRNGGKTWQRLDAGLPENRPGGR